MLTRLDLQGLFGTKGEVSPDGETTGSADSSNIIETGDFRIDLLDRSASLRGRELELTSEEFDVLVYLVGHPQRLVTSQTMLATRWTATRMKETEFLRVLLSLRSKLDAVGPDQHYLRTERWVVYKFNPASSTTAA